MARGGKKGSEQSLTQALAAHLDKQLLPDLRERAKAKGVAEAFRARHEAERKDARTGQSLEEWTEAQLEQIGAAWILSCVFVRTLEDRKLVPNRRIAGEGAKDSEQLFFDLAPSLSAREYLQTIFREVARYPGAIDVLGPKANLAWKLAPSTDAARALLDFFRAQRDDGSLRWTFEGEDTRFLGDLYQDLSASVRERYALLQTPVFVEEFILDLTLDPAIETFGLEEVKILDPTCGSGHFLLGAFERLVERRRAKAPGIDVKEHALAALEQVHGADINPYAVAIARFRLTLSYLAKIGATSLAKIPERLPLHVIVADSLYYGAKGSQRRLSERSDDRAGWGDERFIVEDPDEAWNLLAQERYHAVVGNPPYITCKDPALREEYRKLYPQSAAGKYALAAPFTERFFQGAIDGGFVGMINANSFMKREFGKKLIEEFLKTVELTTVIDTSGAYIPGHGTPTVLLFGRNRASDASTVHAVLGKRGEPATPEDAERGVVWSSITSHHKQGGFDNEYISVADVARETFEKHPWTLGGGGASELKELLEERAPQRLRELATIGVFGMTNADDCFVLTRGEWTRTAVEGEYIKRIFVGEDIRDWSWQSELRALYPYRWPASLVRLEDTPGLHKYLWPFRALLGNRATFGGGTYFSDGLPWWKWHQVTADRVEGLSIGLAFVATHNHFVLNRERAVFGRSAPIIKLPEGATDEDHLALLGYLNSSTACFWMKQVLFPKYGAVKADHPDPARNFYEFAGTALLALPIPDLSSIKPLLVSASRELSELGESRSMLLSRATIERDGVETGEALDEILRKRWARLDEMRRRAVYLQEEIDWAVYCSFHLAPQELGSPLLSDATIARGFRAFEACSERRSLIRRNGALLPAAIAELDTAPPFVHREDLRAIWAQRREFLKRDPQLQLIETNVFKRLWRDSEQNETEAEYRQSLRTAVSAEVFLDAVERAISSRAAIRSASRLATDLSTLPAIYQHGDSSQSVIADAAVPFLAAYRYTDIGFEKRAAWERTWELQRQEDAGAKVSIPVPPKYDAKDFLDPRYFQIRGKLDVPKERFISYPGCEKDDDPSPLFGWAGWNHLERAIALAELYRERKTEDGWGKDLLTPILAGILELVPWIKQWHNEPDPDGNRMGDEFERYVSEEGRSFGLTFDDLRAWRPERKSKRSKKK